MSHEYDFEKSQVAPEQKKNFISMFAVMLGFTFFSASMWTGATLGAGLTISKFVLAVLAGNLILGIYTMALAWIAGSTGLSIHLLSRYAFGRKGSCVPSFLLGLTQVGWFGVGIAMLAFPIQKYLQAQGIQCNIWIPTLISGVLMTSSAYWGIKAITIVSVIAVPAVALGGGFSAVKVFTDNPEAWNTMQNFVPQADKALTMSGAIALTVGSFISGGTCTPDFVRFASSRKTAVITTGVAFFIGNSLMFIFGAVGGMFYNTNDISNVLVAQGLLIPGIIVLAMNIWTTNDNALYTSGLGFSNITGFPKRYVVLFNGALGTALSIILYNNFCGYLSMLNNFLPPIGAIIAADFFILRKRGKDYEALDDLAKERSLRWSAIIALAAGAAAAFVIPWGISSINAIVIAFAVYVICNYKTLKKSV